MISEHFTFLRLGIEDSVVHQLHIFYIYNGNSYRIFRISLLPDKGEGAGISVGSFDNEFFVARIDANGQLVKELPLVKFPHVTLHNNHFFHLIPDKGEPIYTAITFGAANSERRIYIPWITMITSPIAKLNKMGLKAQSGVTSINNKRVMELSFPVTNIGQSIAMYIDFANAEHCESELERRQSSFIKWGNTLLRIRVAPIDGQAATVKLDGGYESTS